MDLIEKTNMQDKYHETATIYQEAAQDVAKAFMEWESMMARFKEGLSQSLRELRDIRMAMSSEIHTITSDLQGISALLASDSSKHARDAAAELCTIGERLTALKKSGALDSIVAAVLVSNNAAR